MKLVDKVCRTCGRTFSSTTPSRLQVDCPSCHKAIKRAEYYVRECVRKGRVSREDAAAMREARIADVKRMLAANSVPLPSHRCPYCGRTTLDKDGRYCIRCTREGFRNLHEMFGKTNGWDRRATSGAVEVADGWRGQPRAGGCAHGFKERI